MKHIERITVWLLILLVSLTCWGLAKIDWASIKKEERTEICVNAPQDMEKAFNSALKSANLQNDYKIVITDSSSASITVVEGGANEEEYQKIAFSPFVCAMSRSISSRKMQKAGILEKSQFDSNEQVMDLYDIIIKVISGISWDYINVKDQNGHSLGDIIVYYPDESTTYWNDFYNFMLVTLNDGEYPKDETQLQHAEDIMQKFFDNKNTIAVTDFAERVARNGGFTANSVYLIPEKLVTDLSNELSKQVEILYPKYTTYYSYYICCAVDDEVASSIVENLSNGGFYKCLSRKIYRSNYVQNVNEFYIPLQVWGMSDIYNIVNNLELKDELNYDETDNENNDETDHDNETNHKSNQDITTN